jgi:hypothetical protein
MVLVRLAGTEVSEGFCTKLAGLFGPIPACYVRINFSDRVPQVSIKAETGGKVFHEYTPTNLPSSSTAENKQQLNSSHDQNSQRLPIV